MSVSGPPADAVPMSELSQALDEIYALRSLLAYEASVRAADLNLATFPKSRRQIAECAVTRMRDAARGHARAVTRTITSRALNTARTDADMGLLTRHQWQQEMNRDV